MTAADDRQREYHTPRRTIYPPLYWYDIGSQYNHRSNKQSRYTQREPETLKDLWNFLKEVGSLDFLDCRTPLDVI